jgi:hypothetical protein
LLIKMVRRWFNAYVKVFFAFVVLDKGNLDILCGGFLCGVQALPTWEKYGAGVVILGAIIELVHQLRRDRQEQEKDVTIQMLLDADSARQRSRRGGGY